MLGSAYLQYEKLVFQVRFLMFIPERGNTQWRVVKNPHWPTFLPMVPNRLPTVCTRWPLATFDPWWSWVIDVTHGLRRPCDWNPCVSKLMTWRMSTWAWFPVKPSEWRNQENYCNNVDRVTEIWERPLEQMSMLSAELSLRVLLIIRLLPSVAAVIWWFAGHLGWLDSSNSVNSIFWVTRSILMRLHLLLFLLYHYLLLWHCCRFIMYKQN